MRKAWFFCFLLPGLLAGCVSNPPADALPEVSETLDAIGRRLSQSLSEIQAHGRGHARFRAPVPPQGAGARRLGPRLPAVPSDRTRRGRGRRSRESSVPFWIHDQGFVATGETLANLDGRWLLFRKAFPPGWIGLGVNGLDRSPPAHYVVFLRSPPDRRAASGGFDHAGPGVGGPLAQAESPGPASARRGRSAGPSRRFPHRSRVPSCSSRSTIDATPRCWRVARVWKTQGPLGEFSRPGHDRVRIRSRPRAGLELANRAGRPATRPSGSSPRASRRPRTTCTMDPDLTGMRVVAGTSTLVRSPNLLNDPVIRRHVVSVGDLSPDTTYLYSLKAGDGRWGPWRTAKTGRSSSGRLEFLYMGDAQTGLEDWGKRLVTAYRRHPGLEFILLAGDLVDRGNERTNWDHFFLRAEEIFERMPVMPCVGNHEYLDMGPRLYRSFFALPRNGPDGIAPGPGLSLRGGVRLHRRSRQHPRGLRRTRGQTPGELARRRPLPTPGPSGSSSCSTTRSIRRIPGATRRHCGSTGCRCSTSIAWTSSSRATITPTCGPIRCAGHRRVSAGEPGTIYVVSVAGDKFCEQPPREYIEVGFTETSTYQTIEIDDQTHRLTYRAWNDAGEVADRLVLTHPGPAEPAVFAGRERAGLR